MSTWAVVLAAGSGQRSGGIAKQFLDVGGQRAVDRVVRTVAAVVDDVVVVLPAGAAWDGPDVTAAVAGGPSRAASVRAGLAAVAPDAAVIVVHDAAHPLVREHLVSAVVEAVRGGADAAVCVVPMTEVVDRVEGDRVLEVLPKHDQVLAQSPAAFRAAVLRAVHEGDPEAVEDVGLVSAAGATVVTVPGDPLNLHVTTVEEWHMACALAPLRDRRPGPAPGGTA